MTQELINVRHMQKADIPALVECERRSHAVEFDLPELPQLGKIESTEPWAWNESDVLRAVRQYRRKEECVYDTRAIVAEVSKPFLDLETKEPFDGLVVAGGCVYELQDDAYEILLLTAMPTDEGKDVRHALIEKLLLRSGRSPKRTKVSITIPDGDYVTLQFFRKLGWAAKLLPNFYHDQNDAWHCEYQATPDENAE